MDGAPGDPGAPVSVVRYDISTQHILLVFNIHPDSGSNVVNGGLVYSFDVDLRKDSWSG